MKIMLLIQPNEFCVPFNIGFSLVFWKKTREWQNDIKDFLLIQFFNDLTVSLG